MNVRELTIDRLREHLRDRVGAAVQALGADVAVELVAPPSPDMGDYGFPCFPLAKTLRRAPAQIARDVAQQIEPDAVVEQATAAGPYVNLHVRKQTLVQVTIGQVLRERGQYGRRQGPAAAQHWMVEYSSPNTNKPLHLGHLRNNLLGASIAAILGHHGHQVTRVNLVNDRGVHICKSMLAYQQWGEGSDPARAGKKGDHFVGDFYVLFEQRFAEEYADWQRSDEAQQRYAEWLEQPAGRAASEAAHKDPAAPAPRRLFFVQYRDEYFNRDSALGAQVRRMLLAWEAGDEQVLALWRQLNGWVLEGFDQTYRRMGVGFELTQLESETYKLGKELVRQGLEQGVLQRRSDGAVTCDLSQIGASGEKILLRADGTSVYMTQDLGTAVERFDRFDLHRLVYVVGDEQNYHFDVLFKILGLLRPGLTERCYHLSYGMIRLPEGKMKSREGTVVDADDLMDEMHELARSETEARAAEGKAHTEGIDGQELEHRAELIGMAALKYFLLKFSPRKSFEYDPRESIDFLGQTGPYCLFNYARTRSLMRRAGGEPPFDADAIARLGTERELEIVRLLGNFPDVVERAVRGLDPSRVAEYCFELCKSFAFVFTDKAHHPIVTCADQPLRQARLLMAAAVSETLRTALRLLGIDVLEEM